MKEIVIRMSDYQYDKTIRGFYIPQEIADIIKNGTLLPKHGRLIDAMRLKAKMFDLPKNSNTAYWDGVDDVGDLIDSAPTIIDREGEGEDEADN